MMTCASNCNKNCCVKTKYIIKVYYLQHESKEDLLGYAILGVGETRQWVIQNIVPHIQKSTKFNTRQDADKAKASMDKWLVVRNDNKFAAFTRVAPFRINRKKRGNDDK
jgi:hypothetical protein